MAEDVKELDQEQEQAVAEQKPVRKPVVGPDITQLVTKVSIVAAVALVAVIAAFFLTVKVLKPMMAADPNAVQEQVEAAAEEETEDEGHGESAEPAEEFLYEIDQIIVNPASTVGSRFLSCSMAFELGSREDLDRFESREIQIRDALITILSARTVDELADARLREPLRRQILTRVNRITEPTEAEAVYFKDFVLQ